MVKSLQKMSDKELKDLQSSRWIKWVNLSEKEQVAKRLLDDTNLEKVRRLLEKLRKKPDTKKKKTRRM